MEMGKWRWENGDGKWETETQCRFIEYQNKYKLGEINRRS